MKILFTGGGTGGSVMPLIAVYKKLPKLNSKPFSFFWIGGVDGLEKEIISNYNNITYYPISSGKFRRYFSIKNFIDIFRILKGFYQSIRILRKIKPNIIITAGSYISVPVVWAGAMLRIPILVHQQDLQPGLANKIMSNYAKKISVSWSDSLKNYPAHKTIYTGNPVREEILEENQKEIENIKKKYNLDNLPTVLIIGGGTGADIISKAIIQHLEKLVTIVNIFHITGKDKKIKIPDVIKNIDRYHQFEFVGKELTAMMRLSDLVITRAGMSTLSELSVMGKPLVIVPMPSTHQEKNANIFYKNNAAVIFEQKYLEDERFFDLIKSLISSSARLHNLSLNAKKMMPIDATEKMARVVLDMIDLK